MSAYERRILMLVDPDAGQCRRITAMTAREGWSTILASDAKAAMTSLKGTAPNAVLINETKLGQSACDLVTSIHTVRPELPIILMIGSECTATGVEAMRAGATDYFVLPVTSERLAQSLRCAQLCQSHQNELTPLAEKLDLTLTFDELLGSSPDYRTAVTLAQEAAAEHTNILIEGEAGSGKEALIRAIHQASDHADMPLHIINISHTPASMIESTLFGHEKDAFPGAFDKTPGLLVTCNGGILALDDIERLPPAIQERLLESLIRRDVRAIGARMTTPVNVRIIATVNTPVAELVSSGHFLPGLAQIISHQTITLPPLRERAYDIPALSTFFLDHIGQMPGLRPLAIDEEALDLLQSYSWPGNIRELQAVLFRAAVFCDNEELSVDDFPQLLTLAKSPPRQTAPNPLQNARPTDFTIFSSDGNLRPLEDIEGDVIRLAVAHYRGRMSEVARRLGIGRSTLYRKINDLGIHGTT